MLLKSTRVNDLVSLNNLHRYEDNMGSVAQTGRSYQNLSPRVTDEPEQLLNEKQLVSNRKTANANSFVLLSLHLG